MKNPMKRARRWFSLAVIVISLTSWIVLPGRFRSWIEPTAQAATFTVNFASDGGDSNPGNGVCDDGMGACTLRAAIQEANALPGLDTIKINVTCINLPPPFSVTCTVPTISPASALPTITQPVIIDGTGQTKDAVVVGRVLLDGTNAGASANGLDITAGNSTVRGLVISNFKGNGILLSGGGINVIEGNYIGTDFNGTAAAGNGSGGVLRAGVYIDNSPDNIIGGTTEAARNVISGNSGPESNGVVIYGNGTGNKVQGNYIGTNVVGSAAIPNFVGVYSFSPGTIIGGTTAAARNVISGNGNGVLLGGSLAIGQTGSVLQANFIGTKANGTEPLGNASSGVRVVSPNISIGGTSGTTPGGPCTGACNVISGNGVGIEVAVLGPQMQVQGNFIGTDVTGTADLGNSSSGVVINAQIAINYDGNGIAIGGTTPAARNVISGNNGDGVKITTGFGTNKVQGNFIGTKANGTEALPNTLHGVSVGGPTNTIGGTTSGAGNVISGNGLSGIFITGSGNPVQGNFIGTDITGAIDLGNAGTGVLVSGPDNTIGGTTVQARNVISGNNGDGISIGATGNQVQGNYIGTKFNGTEALGNNGEGVLVGAPNNTIGGTAAGARNIISGNKLNGVFITSPGNQVQGNFIGTDVNGTAKLGNSMHGVLVYASNNTIGGTANGARNIISGNSTGIGLDGGGVTGCRVEGNYIGTDLTGANDLGNGTGVAISTNASGNTIGGTTAAARNVISGNGAGMNLSTGATGNQIQGNFIGTNASGTGALGNDFSGVRIAAATNNTIGGTVAGARNIISGNGGGIRLTEDAAGNKVEGNYIGTDVAGAGDLGNVNEGVFMDNAPNNTIGGTTAGAGNVISGNNASGVRILDDKATGNKVQGNFIGTKANGTEALPNSSYGVYIKSASTNSIGGTASGAGNTIAFNGDDGVFIEAGNAGAIDNAILSNSIFSNTGLGIDLDPNGVTPNDANDADPGANKLQNFPVLTSALSVAGNTTIQGTLNSTANTQFRLEFFANASCDAAGNGEGQTFIGTAAVTTGANGNFSFNTSFPIPVPSGQVITATATDPTNNTSEFSLCLAVVTPGALQFSSATYTVNENGGNATITVTRTDGSDGIVSINYGTSDGTATAGADYSSASGTLTFAAGVASQSFVVPIIDDSIDEVDETVTLILANPTGGAALGTPSTAVLTILDNDVAPTPTPTPTPNVVQFSSSTYSVVEDCTTVTITVNRIGDTSGTATVDYSTSDVMASERRDYITALGRLTFAPGEPSGSFAVLINEDSYVEGTETFNVNLSNPSGMSLGAPAITTVTITDDVAEPATNVIDDPQNFVCQHYHDFLNREPDASGLAFWTSTITSCANQACIEVNRINVSAAFYLSIEFQQTGYLVERVYKAAYGNANGTSTFGGTHQLPVPIVRFTEFLLDTQQIGKGVVVLQPGWETVLENNKQAFTAEFVQRTRFTTAFPTSMTPAQFVDALFDNAGVIPSASDRQAAVDEFGGAGTSANLLARGRALRRVAENGTLAQQEFNRAFVLMQYIGYLRRNPDDPQDTDYTGYDFWLTKLDQFNGNFINAEMVKAFITSIEYRNRFGP